MLLVLLAVSAVLAAPSPSRPALAAVAVETGAVRIDGRLDEAAWAGAPAASGFVQLRPASGAAATEVTEARVVYDTDALYVGMRMHDSQPHRIDRQLGRRDASLESDWAQVAIDSYGDDRTAFAFEVNAAGVQGDALLFDDVRDDDSWDAVWDVAVSTDATGWTAEFRIPFSQLRFAASDGEQPWGIEFGRRHFRTGEQSFWAPIDPEVNGVVSQFGSLSGVRGLRPPRQLEIVPYLASAATRAPEPAPLNGIADPFFRPTDLDPRVGVDLKLGLTSDLTLTATVNPDFGQVEADPAQVNLGGFELFFQERRPFFVEGLDVFNMEPRRFFANNRPDLLYTRRIGRAPQRQEFVPASAREAVTHAGVIYSDAPGQSTILGAAKISGRVGRVSLGVLSATTAPEYGTYQAFHPDGRLATDGRALVEPLSTFLVGRSRATVGRTLIGGLATVVARDTGDPVLDAMMPTLAAVAGVDVERPLGEQWTVSAQVAGSTVAGSAAAITGLQSAFPRLYQRPDADHLGLDPTRTRLSGLTAEANVLKTSGEHWVGGLHAGLTTPGFDSNDLGFQSRADYVSLGGVWVYQQNQARGVVQRWNQNVFAGSGWNTGGDRITSFVGGNTSVQFTNFWGLNLNYDLAPRTDDDRLTRGGPLARRDAGGSLNLYAYSDERKPVSGSLSGGVYANELGRWGSYGSLGLTARPASAVSVSLEPSVSVSQDPRQYVTAFDEPAATATFGRRYVFGALDATTVAVEARVNWTFTPDLSLQLYARPFATRGRYAGFSTFDRPGAFRLPVFGVDQGSATESQVDNGDGTTRTVTTIEPGDGGAPFAVARDFTLRSVQGNAVLRWQYRPGSSLFLVWQQQREAFLRDGSLTVDRDLRGAFRDTPTNVFLIKLSYWLGG